MQVVVDWDRACKVFDTLVDECRNNRYPYDRRKPPQIKENLPKSLVWGSVEHACFLFCSCYYMRGGIRSDTAFLALAAYYEEDSEAFIPENFSRSGCRYTPEHIEERLRFYGLGFQAKRNSLFWFFNFRKLAQFWNGDPASIFRKSQTYDDLVNIIVGQGRKREENPNGFFGFRKKMVSMITYFLLHAGIVEKLSHPIPVDFHVLRMLVEHEVLSIPGIPMGEGLPLEPLQDMARDLTQKYCALKGVDELLLCDSLWLYSSYMCRQHPGNMSVVAKERSGRSTEVTPLVYDWTESRVSSYYSTCGQCQVARTCKYLVPAAPYYVKGILVRRGIRTPPPQGFLAF